MEEAADGDIYEDDDSAMRATKIIVNNESQTHKFHDYEDQDWVWFYGVSEKTYTLTANNKHVTCDAVIELYDDINAGTPIEKSDNTDTAGKENRLKWDCTQDGLYYVKLYDFKANFGERTEYDFKISVLTAGDYGFITGKVTDAACGWPIPNATIKTNGGADLTSRPGGEYTVTQEVGTGTISIEASGYKPRNDLSVTISEQGEEKLFNIELEPLTEPLKGDINADGNSDLADAVIALKVSAGIASNIVCLPAADVNADGKIGLEDTICVIQKLAGSRE
ncbi:MAG: hypothetical protein GY795_42890 [Desulfobacterales bacterium]|nr:hypothetical protein [Desulfobacterales bacterium]